MVEAGIPPLAVLSIATLNGAKLLRIDDSAGSVETGKLANLVILNADPVADINNSREISGLVLKGSLVDPAEFLIRYGQSK